MELNWSTFLLEIINFLVLVWILKRFLYRPILSVLDKRRDDIEMKLKKADQQQSEAIGLEKKYHQRLDQWELEKQQLRDEFQHEIQTEKTRKLQALKTDLDNERKKASVIEQRHQNESLKKLQKHAHQQGAHFASKLLSAVACEAVEAQLFNLLIQSLECLEQSQKTTIKNACPASAQPVTVTSTYNISDEQLTQLQNKLSDICGQTLTIKYAQDSSLLAGLRIVIGSFVLAVNLQDELNGFTELLNDNE